MQANQSLDGIKRIRILAKPLPEEGFCLIPAFLRKPELTELHVSDSSTGSNSLELITNGFQSSPIPAARGACSQRLPCLRESWTEPHGFAPLVFRLIRVPFLLECQTKLVVGHGIFGGAFESRLKRLNGLVQLSLL